MFKKKTFIKLNFIELSSVSKCKSKKLLPKISFIKSTFTNLLNLHIIYLCLLISFEKET